MAQLMLCLDIRRDCRQPIEIEGFNIPEWGLEAPFSDADPSEIVILDQRTRRWAICLMIDALKPRLVHVKAMTFRIKNFCAPELYDRYFPTTIATSQKLPEDTLLVHIRAGDVSTLTHSSYGPLPISYYQYLAKFTGLKLAFVGELSESDYVQALREQFLILYFSKGGARWTISKRSAARKTWRLRFPASRGWPRFCRVKLKPFIFPLLAFLTH